MANQLATENAQDLRSCGLEPSSVQIRPPAIPKGEIMELKEFSIAGSERNLIDSNKEVASVKTSVKVDNWVINQGMMEVEFTYLARYLGTETVINTPEIASLTAKGRLKLSINQNEEREINEYKSSKDQPQNNFVGISKFSPNYATLTLPRNYTLEISRIADERCKALALEVLNSINGHSQPGR